MPGMRLTPEQVQRLCGVERAPCRLALDALVASESLCVKATDTTLASRMAATRPVGFPRQQT